MEDDRGFNFMLSYAAAEIQGWSGPEFDSVSVQEFRDKVLARMKAEK
jgi:hypothetical protein